MADVEDLFSSHAAAAGRQLVIEVAPEDLAVCTDAQLLLRVLANMVRNAFEAIAPGGTVTLSASPAAEAGEWTRAGVHFALHNPGAIPADIRPRIFTRSFTTKGGRGRGLGTYGMKLLGERYLGGEVRLDSSGEAGTLLPGPL